MRDVRQNMKIHIRAWIAAAHYLLGRTAEALPEGIRVRSFPRITRIVPYSEIQQCVIRPVHERIRVYSEMSDIRYQRIVLTGKRPYAMKMTTTKSEAFVRHLGRYAAKIKILKAPQRNWSIEIPQN
jgi:hypothetical protein